MLSKVYEPTMGKIIAAERELKNIENRFWRSVEHSLSGTKPL